MDFTYQPVERYRAIMALLFSFPNANYLDMFKFKVFAADKIKVAKIMISVFDRVESMFSKGFLFLGLLKVRIVL